MRRKEATERQLLFLKSRRRIVRKPKEDGPFPLADQESVHGQRQRTVMNRISLLPLSLFLSPTVF